MLADSPSFSEDAPRFPYRVLGGDIVPGGGGDRRNLAPAEVLTSDFFDLPASISTRTVLPCTVFQRLNGGQSDLFRIFLTMQ